MSVRLELADIQGNVLSAYGRLGFPKGRFLLLNIADADAGRSVIELLRRRVTTALRWPSDRTPYPAGTIYQKRPEVTLNLAFTFRGLLALDVPIRTLRGMPDEFIDGMAARADILGDNLPADTNDGKGARSIDDLWDPVWLDQKDPRRRIHVLVTLNTDMDKTTGAPSERLDEMTREIAGLCSATQGGVTLLSGHRGDNPAWQDLSAITTRQDNGDFIPLPFEHFGFRDAIGDPLFDGQVPPDLAAERVVGQGKLLPDQSWAPIATGEFLLGYPDESQEIAGAAMPLDFSRNGTFYAYRKLHQNVAAWRRYLAAQAEPFAAVMDIPRDQAVPTLMAKFAGRWPDGVPLMAAPTYDEWQVVVRRRAEAERADDKATIAAMERALVEFTFRDDPAGVKCPFSSHLRRANTRDMLDPLFGATDRKRWGGSILNNRRRILRRGLPYGQAPDGDDDSGEHGIVMLACCASLFRQFEFVQQQWMQYGLDFGSGNDTCPIVGTHGKDAKYVIATDPASGKPPFICGSLPHFVETRGGDYFFVPSMTALRMIASGTVDPT
jgi:deferrochelatase/peroxidase EfeB